jgi:biopolymer transport protein ExbD
MMRLARSPQPKRPAENVIPMINVVFLLLVFFLITARITPPLPVEVEPPTASGKAFDAGPNVFVLGPDGTAHFAGLSGEEAWVALGSREGGNRITLRVDRGMDGALLTRALTRASGRGVGPVDLVVQE